MRPRLDVIAPTRVGTAQDADECWFDETDVMFKDTDAQNRALMKLGET